MPDNQLGEPAIHLITDLWGPHIVSLISAHQKIDYILPLDAFTVVGADGVHAQNRLGIIIGQRGKHAEFTLNGRLGSEQIADLDVLFLFLSGCDKIDFRIAQLSDRHFVAPSFQLEIHQVFKQSIDRRLPITEHAVPQADITKVILLVDLKIAFAFDVIALDAIQCVGFRQVTKIFLDRIDGDAQAL